MKRLAHLGAITAAWCGLALSSSVMAINHAPPPGSVVWDQALGTGSIDNSLADNAHGTNYADSVTFLDTTTVGGINLFSSVDLSGHAGQADFQLKILADNAGMPGAALFIGDVGITRASVDVAPGVNRYDFSFAPYTFAGGVTYWVGISGNGFDSSVLTLQSPQDGRLARFSGNAFVGMPQVGDQMFQLTAAAPVPEPETLALMLLGLTGMVAIVRRQRRR